MPDPIISDQIQDSTPVTFPEMTDTPTVPAVPQDTSTAIQGSEPMDIPPMIVDSPSPKRKSRKIIATILGVLLLVGAVGAGVVLVGQKQLFKQKAQQKTTGNCTYNCGAVCIDSVMCPDPNYDATCTDEDCPPGYAVCSCEPNEGGGGGGKCDDGTDPDGCVKYICPYGDTNNSTTCDEGDTGVSWNFYSMAECSNMTCGIQCCQIDWTKNNIYCGFKTKNLSCVHESPPPTSTNTPTPTPTKSPTPTPTKSPTPTPTKSPTPTPTGPKSPTPTPTPPTAACSVVKAYDTNWNLLDKQLFALHAGDIVRFTVSGTPAKEIDKARFTINGVLKPETTDKKPGTDEYYIEYTIPAGVSSFTVTAQIHHLTLGWF